MRRRSLRLGLGLLALVVALLAALPAAGAQAAPAAGKTAGRTVGTGAVPAVTGVCSSHWNVSQWPPPTIRQGAVDTTDPSAVKLAQCYLNLSVLSVNLTIDGRFGNQTDAATRLFQGASCANVAGGADGSIGLHTWTALRSWANSPNFAC